MKMIDVLMINDEEARQLTGIIPRKRAEDHGYGPKYLIIKKENTAHYYFMATMFSLPRRSPKNI
jgi:sugar/nucleoside kinase (ribokinase family)